MGIQFDEKELQVIGIATHFRANRGSAAPIFNTPISMRENWRRMAVEKKPLWLNTGVEMFNFYPDIIPDNRARGFVNDGGMKLSDEEKGGKDMFGIEWVYVPVAGGSMEKPGEPHLFEDANEFEEHIIWPDIESWDWEGCSQRNKAFLDNGEFNYMTMLNGFGFERLVSFMGFEMPPWHWWMKNSAMRCTRCSTRLQTSTVQLLTKVVSILTLTDLSSMTTGVLSGLPSSLLMLGVSCWFPI